MKKKTRFQKLLRDKTIRSKLTKDFKASTVSMWASGERIPSWDNANKIAGILKVDVIEIPYYRIEINI